MAIFLSFPEGGLNIRWGKLVQCHGDAVAYLPCRIGAQGI